MIIYFSSPPPCPESRKRGLGRKGKVREVSHKSMQTRLEIRQGRGEREREAEWKGGVCQGR